MISALARAGVGLLLSSEALNDPIPQLCGEAGMLAAQYLEPLDVQAVVEASGVRPLAPDDIADLDAVLGGGDKRGSECVGIVEDVSEVSAGGRTFTHLAGLGSTVKRRSRTAADDDAAAASIEDPALWRQVP